MKGQLRRLCTNFTLLMAGVLATGLLAAGGAPVAAQSAPSNPSSQDNVEASAGELRIIHLWSREPEAFLAAWSGPTPPNLPVSSTMERDQVIQQFVLYANCTRDDAGECRVTARVDIFAPDGSTYGEAFEFPVVEGVSTVPAGSIGLGPGGVALRVEEGEQLGHYRIELRATDHVSGLTATSIVHLEAVERGALSDAI